MSIFKNLSTLGSNFIFLLKFNLCIAAFGGELSSGKGKGKGGKSTGKESGKSNRRMKSASKSKKTTEPVSANALAVSSDHQNFTIIIQRVLTIFIVRTPKIDMCYQNYGVSENKQAYFVQRKVSFSHIGYCSVCQQI